MRVGCAGLGRMGALMARILHTSGNTVTIWNRTPLTSEKFSLETDCQVAATPVDLAACVEVVITMLADDAASNEVYLGKNGFLTSHEGAKIFVEMSTVSPAHIDLLQQNAGRHLIIDATVSGATQAARGGTLMIMAGATLQQTEPVQPLFYAMGSKTIAIGHQGAGAVMKLAINSIIHGLN